MNALTRFESLARVLCLAALLPLLAATGCSDDDPTGPSQVFAHGATATADGLQLSVATEAASYAFGTSFDIEVVLTNVSDHPQMLDFLRGNPARYPNLSINAVSESDVSHFVDGDGELDVYELAPGKSLRAVFTWDQDSRFTRAPVDRGVYEMVAFVGFDDRDTLRVDGLFVELD